MPDEWKNGIGLLWSALPGQVSGTVLLQDYFKISKLHHIVPRKLYM